MSFTKCPVCGGFNAGPDEWSLQQCACHRIPQGTHATSTNTGMNAIALWNEYLSHCRGDIPVYWLQANRDRINAVVAQQHHT
jgi:hypothetical protein